MKDWSTATADEIKRDMRGWYDSIANAVTPDSFTLYPYQRDYIDWLTERPSWVRKLFDARTNTAGPKIEIRRVSRFITDDARFITPDPVVVPPWTPPGGRLALLSSTSREAYQ